MKQKNGISGIQKIRKIVKFSLILVAMTFEKKNTKISLIPGFILLHPVNVTNYKIFGKK